jgi:hypothetical protein
VYVCALDRPWIGDLTDRLAGSTPSWSIIPKLESVRVREVRFSSDSIHRLTFPHIIVIIRVGFCITLHPARYSRYAYLRL